MVKALALTQGQRRIGCSLSPGRSRSSCSPCGFHWHCWSWEDSNIIYWWEWTIQSLLALVGLEPHFSVMFDWKRLCWFWGFFSSLKLFCLARLLFVWLEGKLVYVFFVCFICCFLSAHWHFWFADSSSKSGIHEAERELTIVMFLKNLLMLVLYIIVTFG